jgi:hypothetical protein
MSDEEVMTLCMSRMTSFAIPGRKIVQPSKLIRTRWASDPFSMGAYSYWAKGNEPGPL